MYKALGLSKLLDKRPGILYNSRALYGAVAQLARAFGSYPKCHRFESSQRYQKGGTSSDVSPFQVNMARWSSG